jgi:hypothetical protein
LSCNPPSSEEEVEDKEEKEDGGVEDEEEEDGDMVEGEEEEDSDEIKERARSTTMSLPRPRSR